VDVDGDPGAGADVVVDAVGLPVTRRRAVELLRPGGCAVLLGLADDAAPVDLGGVVRAGLTMRGSYAYTPADFDAALEHLLAGRAGLGPLEAVLPLASGPEQFAALAAGPSGRVRAFLAPP
jgi:threonine dehydrogenase-like Zn-dependent dehydrogenase